MSLLLKKKGFKIFRKKIKRKLQIKIQNWEKILKKIKFEN